MASSLSEILTSYGKPQLGNGESGGTPVNGQQVVDQNQETQPQTSYGNDITMDAVERREQAQNEAQDQQQKDLRQRKTSMPPLKDITGAKNYQEMLDAFEQKQEQEEAARKKRERISAFGNLAMALSNLYFTTKGAPNMYKAPEDKDTSKYDALRESGKQYVLQQRMNALKQERKDELARKEQANKDFITAAQADYYDKKGGLITEQTRAAKAKADKTEEDTKNSQSFAKANLDLIAAKAEKERAQGKAAVMKANKKTSSGDKGSGENSGKKYKYNVDQEDSDEPWGTDSEKDYEAYVYSMARKYNIKLYTVVQDTEKPKPKPITRLVSEINEEVARRKAKKKEERTVTGGKWGQNSK